jgi:hypothetical protein
MAKKPAALRVESNRPITLNQLDRMLANALKNLEKAPPKVKAARRNIKNARTCLHDVCRLPPYDL